MSIGKHSKPGPERAGRLALPGLLALLAFSLVACGRAPEARGAAVPATPGRHAASAPKDVEIQEDPVKTGIDAGDANLASRVRARFAADPRLRSLPIEIDAEGGRVTLWGRVDSAEDLAAAEQQARRTPGVVAVINLVKVAG